MGIDLPQDSPFVFTDHVRALAAPGKVPVSATSSLLNKLKSALVRELRHRSLWCLRPSRIGIYGASSWTDPGALDELTADCYVTAILEKLPSLVAQTRRKDNVEGLVHRNISNYLYERQRHHDPLGLRTFNILQRAARKALDSGRLRVLAGNSKVRNSTVLGPASESEASGDGEPLAADRLRELVSVWIDDDIWPDIVTARGNALDAVETRLAKRLVELTKDGSTLRFRDVLVPLKNETRQRWYALWSHSGDRPPDEDSGETVRLVRSLRPGFGYEERQALEKLLDCIEEAVERCEQTPAISEYLWRLWSFLRFRVADEEGQEAPSRRRLAELLEIPRNRMTVLFSLLAEWTEACRSARGVGPFAGTSR